jgi:tetratricopeptide (TPR) repeat protein
VRCPISQIVLVGLSLGLLLHLCAAEQQPPKKDSIHWMRNYQDGRKAAVRLHRLMIVSLETDWCTWCAFMDANVFGSPEVSRGLGSHYVFVRQNAEARPDGVTLQRRFQVFSYPSTVVVEPQGEIFVTIRGYRGPQALLTGVGDAAGEVQRLIKIRDRVLLDTASVQAQQELAQAYAQRGLHKRAAELYASMVRNPALPNAPQVYFELALALASAGENEHALSALAQLERQFPNSQVAPEAGALDGEIVLHSGDKIRAKKILRAWLVEYPNNPLADHVRSLLAQLE